MIDIEYRLMCAYEKVRHCHIQEYDLFSSNSVLSFVIQYIKTTCKETGLATKTHTHTNTAISSSFSIDERVAFVSLNFDGEGQGHMHLSESYHQA